MVEQPTTGTPNGLPLPDFSGFEDEAPKKKQRYTVATTFRNNDSTTTSNFFTPTPQRCPETPQRTPGISRIRGIIHNNVPMTVQPRRQGAISIDQFIVLSTIGEGSFGTVFRVRWRKDMKEYALKKSKREIPLSYEMEEDGQECKIRSTEVEQLMRVGGHDNIVSIKASWEEDRHLYILTELCEQSLKQFMSNCEDSLTEDTIRGFAHDMLSGVKHMHAMGVMHFDIKTANILMTKEQALKIADFGIAHRIGDKVGDLEEGDGQYMAPELLNDNFTQAADIFSLGVTLYELANPNYDLPYQGPAWDKLRSGNPDFPEWAYSEDLKQFIKAMLNPDPVARPTAETLLKHPIMVSAHARSKTMKVSAMQTGMRRKLAFTD